MAAPKGNQFWRDADMDKIGRPKMFSDPKDMLVLISEYFLSYESNGEDAPNPVLGYKPTVTGLALYLGFESRQSIYDYIHNHKEFTYILKKALLHIEMNYEQLLESKASTGAIFALKNMGWKDKIEQDINSKQEIVWNEEKTYEADSEAD